MILDSFRSQIHGMVHCSGGAQTKVLHFIEDLHVIKNNLFPIPPLFKLIQQQSQTNWQEMYQVFNMGHRMELYVPQAIASSIIDIATQFGVAAQVVGYVENAINQKQVTLQTPYGDFIYH